MIAQRRCDLRPDAEPAFKALLRLVQKKTIPQVAKALRLSPATVHGYVKEIYKKLNVHNRAELVGKVKKFS